MVRKPTPTFHFRTHCLSRIIGDIALIGLVLITGAAIEPRHILLVWNASRSVPTGPYLIVPRPVHIGQFVVVRLPLTIRDLAEHRHYIGADIPLIKRVAAMNGDLVCRYGSVVVIGRRAIVVALGADTQGRPLPVWRGCLRLRSGQIFVLGMRSDSFDSRYFGPLSSAQIIGPAIPLWPYDLVAILTRQRGPTRQR